MASELSPFGVGLLRLAFRDSPSLALPNSKNETQAKAKSCRSLWKRVGNSVLNKKDIWEGPLLSTEPEVAIEHVYDAELKEWKEIKVLVRIDLEKVVANGAMRECLRMKKICFDSEHLEWLVVRKKPLEEVVPGIGRSTSRWLVKEIIHDGKEHTITVGNLVDRMYTDEKLVYSLLSKVVHDRSKRESAISTCRLLYMRDKILKGKWSHSNFMAKRYKEGVIEPEEAEKVFRHDVIMQEFCKLLAYAYNRQIPCPPKQIDMLHVGLVQLVSRKGKPFLAYESFVEGEYHKWNTNSGWQDVDRIRHTPQAFSFFTFRYTQGKTIVVDVQGVKDLYTDPQVHSSDQNGEYGEGDLGIRGMALFLSTFRYDCNPIVQYMGLAQFPLAPGEQPEPSGKEREHFLDGHKYLKSDVWKRRQVSIERGLSNQTIPYYDNLDEALDEDMISAWLLEFSRSCKVFSVPENAENIVPLSESVQAKVHLALANLHREEDERVSKQRKCSAEDAYSFHLWLSALGGTRDSMNQIASHWYELEDYTMALKWYSLAAKRGSRTANVEAANILSADTKTSVDLQLLAEFYSRAIVTKDEYLNDRERRRNMVVCDYVLHERLAECKLSQGKREECMTNLRIAAELAMHSGMFKFQAKIQEKIDSLVV